MEVNATNNVITWQSWICESELFTCQTVNILPEEYHQDGGTKSSIVISLQGFKVNVLNNSNNNI